MTRNEQERADAAALWKQAEEMRIARWNAARAMLAALRAACPYIDTTGPRGAIAWTLAHEATAQAEAAGITVRP